MHQGLWARLVRVALNCLALAVLAAPSLAQITNTVTVGDNSVNSGISYTDDDATGLNGGATSNPADTKILLGDSVEFTWGNSLDHSVTSMTTGWGIFDCSPFDHPASGGNPCASQFTTAGGTYGPITANSLGVGDWYYQCDFHGSPMQGVVHVLAHGATTKFAVSNPGTQTAGVQFSVTVTAEDRNGNPDTSFNFTGTTFSATEGGGATISVFSTSPGSETLHVTLHAAESQRITATSGGITGNSGFFTVQAGAATHYVMSAPGSTNQGAANSITVTAEDANGNVSGSDNGQTITLSSSTDALATTPSGPISGAQAFISGVIFRTTGTQTLNAAGDLTAPAPASISVGATHLVVSAPASASSGSNVNFTVAAEDSGNAIISTFADTVKISSSDGAATLPANGPLPSGTGSFGITFGTTGSQSIVATDTSTASPTVTGNTSVTIAPNNCPDPQTFSGDIFRNTTEITIPDDTPSTGITGAPYPSPITVSLPGQLIHNLTVTLYGFEHTFFSDVDILLVGPQGQQIVLMSNAAAGETGGSSFNTFHPVDLTFDDAAPAGLPQALSGVSPNDNPVAEGSYQPTAFALTGRPIFNNSGSPAPPQSGYNLPAPAGSATLNSIFDSTDPNGQWNLYVEDNVGGDSGNVLRGWSISINEHRFTNGDGPINYNDVPSASPYPSKIDVSGLAGDIASVSLTLNGFADNFCVAEVGFMLEAPSGQFLVPFTLAGDCIIGPETMNFITLDDGAASALPEFPSSAIAPGSYRPGSYIQTGCCVSNAFFNSPAPGTSPYPSANLAQTDGVGTLGSAFGGSDPNGTWKLFVQHQFTPDGDSGALASWSLSFKLLCRATTSSVTSDFPGGTTYPQAVTLTATVFCSSGTPTGSVTFFDGATNLGTVALNGSGQASLGPIVLLGGNHPITISYPGDTVYSPSTSPIFTQVIHKAATTVTITSVVPSSPSVHNQLITINVQVSATGATPGGNVTFDDNGAPISGAIALSGGKASFATSTLAVGAHSFTVVYAGTRDFLANTSAATPYTVDKGGTTATLISSHLTSTYGQSVLFTATVAANAPSSGTPTGTVTFSDALTSQQITVALVSGTSTLTCPSAACKDPTANTPLAFGTHGITAKYNGDSNFLTSTSALLSQKVNTGATTSTIMTSLTPTNYGQTITFTAKVTATFVTPTGSVNFTDGGFIIGAAALSSGTATLTCPGAGCGLLGGGAHTMGASYTGLPSGCSSACNLGNSNSTTITQTVKPIASSTSVASSSPVISGKPTSTFGDIVIFTATVTVTPGLAPPTGSVTFFDGGSSIGAGSLTASSPPYTAAIATSALSASTHTITAQYGGDSNYLMSPISASISQVVLPASTTTFVGSNNNPSTFGQSVTLTATVSSSGGTPPGSVTFFNGATQIGTPQTLVGGSASVSTSALSGGSHPITATYTPTGGNFTGSTNSPPLMQVVNPEATTLTVVSSQNPAFFRQPITFTVTVHAAVGTPNAGTVTFMDGGTTLCARAPVSVGKATCTVTPAVALGAIGLHNVTAAFNGSVSFAASPSPVPLAPPEYRAPGPGPLP